MPSKKRKYNARFPAGRIKKIMQTDEEVGKVAQAVPIIIYSTPRTLELFVESLLGKAMQVTMQRNAKTLSPSHVKQCILAESRFDFLKDLVKTVPDVTAAEEREMLSGESSPNSSRYSDVSVQRRVVREDSNSSSSSDVRLQQVLPPQRDPVRRDMSIDEKPKIEPISPDLAIDLSKKTEEKPVIPANFYQETLVTDDIPHKSVIKPNPTYASPQPSTSSYANLTPVEPVNKVEVAVPKPEHPAMFYVDVRQNNTPPPRTPSTPILNIDFSKNFARPEIKVLDSAVTNMVSVPKIDKRVQRQNSKTKADVKKIEAKPMPAPIDIDHFNSGNLQIDEDYDT